MNNVWILLFLLLSIHKIRFANGFDRTSLDCNSKSRVVAGIDAPSETWYPSVVHLSFACGATIVNKMWLLTAAHCKVKKGTSVTAGNPYQCRPTGEYEQKRKVIKTFNHQEFEPTMGLNDIALLQIDKPFEFTPAVQPVKLIPRDFEYPETAIATVVGWGETSVSTPVASVSTSAKPVLGDRDRSLNFRVEDPEPEPLGPPQRLQEADVPALSNDTCVKALQKMGSGIEYHPGRICFGYMDSGGRDACRGDSGGPLYYTLSGSVPSKAAWQDHIQIGIVSFGKGCAQRDMPGVYTNVKYYLDWIRKTMDENPPRSQSASLHGFRGGVVISTVVSIIKVSQ